MKNVSNPLRNTALAATAALLLGSPVLAADDNWQQSAEGYRYQLNIDDSAGIDKAELTNRIQSAIRSVMLDTMAEQNLTSMPSFSYSQTAYETIDYGLILGWQNSASDQTGGAWISGVTPGGYFDSLGLKAEDVIQSANGVDLTNMTAEQAAKQLSQVLKGLDNNDQLELNYSRRQQEMQLSSVVEKTMLPAVEVTVKAPKHLFSGIEDDANGVCGEISTIKRTPWEEGIYPLAIVEIDGLNVQQRDAYQLSPGVHTIKVTEQIASYAEISNIPSARIPTNVRRKYLYKEFNVTIEPNKTHRLGVKFDKDVPYRTNLENYWEPVVWEVDDYECVNN